MSLLGRWYRVEDDVHYWRDGFVRSGCGLLGPPFGEDPASSESGCAACVERHSLDLRYSDIAAAESSMGHAVLADAMLDVLEIAVPFSDPAKAWLRDHNLRVRHRDRVAHAAFGLGGEARSIALEPGHYLVSTTHGDFFTVPPEDFENRYRCVKPENLVR